MNQNTAHRRSIPIKYFFFYDFPSTSRQVNIDCDRMLPRLVNSAFTITLVFEIRHYVGSG